jgi:integrase
MDRLNKLTVLGLTKLRVPGYYSDGGGLVLQVSQSGTKSWIFRYSFQGKRHEMGLGSCNFVGLARARQLARECRDLIYQGTDPLAARRAALAARAAENARKMTFDDCTAAYIEAHRGGWSNPKHAAQWTRTLATYASPVIGALPVADVDTDLVVKILAPIWTTKTETATRLRGRIESVLDWATVSKFRQGENPARWRGHLDYLLANPTRVARVRNFPALPWPQVAAFMAELGRREGTSARALEFAILTAARSGEVRGAAWAEIDLARRVWTVPAARMKAGKEHRVPLSDAVIALLRGLPDQDGLLFPGQKHQPLSDMSLSAVLRRMGRPDITVHGFRSTFRDWAAEAPGNAFPREVCEHALAHSLPDRVEAAYQRGDLFGKRIALMQAWADYCGDKPAQQGGDSSGTP